MQISNLCLVGWVIWHYLTGVIPWSIAELRVFIQCCGTGDGLRMIHEFVHIPLLIEVGKAFREPVDEDARVRRFNIHEWIGTILAADGNKGLADRGFRSRREVAVFMYYGLWGCTIDLDSTEQSSVCEQLAPKQQCERSGDGDVNSVFNVCKYRDDDTSEEDDDFQGRCFPELKDDIRRRDEVTNSVNDNGCQSS